MDEAASRLRMQVDSKPEALDELDRRLLQLKIEREALKREEDPASRERLEKLEHELSEIEEKSNAMTAAWHAEKDQPCRLPEAEGAVGHRSQRGGSGATPG